MIEDKLRENAELHPDKLALLCNGESYTYGHLYQLVWIRLFQWRE